MKYRIMIETKNNGSKEYTPQCKTLFFSPWENIIKDYVGILGFRLSISIRQIFKTEKEAYYIICRYKEYIDKTSLKKTKRVTYKTIN